MPKLDPKKKASSPRRGKKRPLFPRIIVGVLVLMVTSTAIWTVRGRDTDMLATARRSDLVQLLDQLTQEARRLEQERGQLEDTKRELTSGVDKEEAARLDAAHRIQVLEILAGYQPAHGSGIVMTITDPDHRVDSAMLLDTIQELRDAGAEVLEINQTHRIVASTWFGDKDGHVTVNGIELPTSSMVIEAIGEPHSLEEGMQFRGGIASQIRNAGGSVQITRVDDLEISSLVAKK